MQEEKEEKYAAKGVSKDPVTRKRNIYDEIELINILTRWVSIQ